MNQRCAHRYYVLGTPSRWVGNGARKWAMHPTHHITKTYPRRGPMQQYRLAESQSFHCFRCSSAKTSKLVVVFAGDWSSLLCNGCYGRILSIHEIRAGAGPEDAKANALAALLMQMVDQDRAIEKARTTLVSKHPDVHLAQSSLRFMGTAELVAETLGTNPSYEWSPAVICLSKAVENELVERVLNPLRDLSTQQDLTSDLGDKDLASVARYCAGRGARPPEMGSIEHFLRTAAFSQTRAAASPLLRCLGRLFSAWPDSRALVAADGLLGALSVLRSEFRNKAAHLGELTMDDYDRCRELVAGNDGILWRLVAATRGHKDEEKFLRNARTKT